MNSLILLGFILRYPEISREVGVESRMRGVANGSHHVSRQIFRKYPIASKPGIFPA